MRAFLLGLALVLTAPFARATPMFMGLGTVPGGNGSSAFAVSADGNTVVGRIESTQPNGLRAFRWTSGTGMVDLGDLGTSNENSEAHGVSADGSVVVGCGNGCGQGAFRWTQATGMVGLGSLPGDVESNANGVSADGSVVVGISWDPVSHAFLWTADTGMVSLGDGAANNVSADGTVVVGVSALAEAFRWTSATGMVGLGILPGMEGSEARGVSGDGSVVVGDSFTPDGAEAFRWTSTGGMVSLGFLPGGNYSEATAVSGDGSIIVGSSNDSAFVWDASHGMRSLTDVLEGYGLDLTGWTLGDAVGVSADGRTIVGTGVNPSGQSEAWLAVLPEPSTALLCAVGLAGLVAVRRLRA